MASFRVKCRAVVAFSSVWLVMFSASAQTPAQPTAPQASAPDTQEPTTDPKQIEARERFSRALELAEDGNHEAALEELKKAYALAPTYRLLYNIGIVYQSLKDSARALDAFERYLDEGGAGVPAERVSEVSSRIERLRTRVSYLDIQIKPEGAEVTVDDLVVGHAPLNRKIRVNSGQRRVTATVSGRPPISRVIELAGNETKVVAMDLTVVQTPVAKDPPKSPVPWICWGVTAALAGAAATTGILALTSTDSYDELAKTPNLDPAVLDRAYDKKQTFALATDILGGAAILSAGVSLYFTIRPPKVKTKENVALYTSGRGVGLRYQF